MSDTRRGLRVASWWVMVGACALVGAAAGTARADLTMPISEKLIVEHYSK